MKLKYEYTSSSPVRATALIEYEHAQITSLRPFPTPPSSAKSTPTKPGQCSYLDVTRERFVRVNHDVSVGVKRSLARSAWNAL